MSTRGRPPVLLPAAINFGMDAASCCMEARAALEGGSPAQAYRAIGAAHVALRRQARALGRLERRGSVRERFVHSARESGPQAATAPAAE